MSTHVPGIQSFLSFFALFYNAKIRRQQHKRFNTSGHDLNFCSDLPSRASEIQLSLAIFQLSLGLEKLYVL